jgi:hypothetical protein
LLLLINSPGTFPWFAFFAANEENPLPDLLARLLSALLCGKLKKDNCTVMRSINTLKLCISCESTGPSLSLLELAGHLMQAKA